ncbi:MAG: hypothetical protein WHT63_11580, partial [Tepidiforma sp.]
LYVYLPSSGNLLREREEHIRKLEGELRQKEAWLEEAKASLAALQAAAGWAADALTTFEAPGGAALALRIRFSDAKEAGEFAVRHRGLLEARAPAVREEPGQLVATRRDGVTVIQLEPDGTAVTLVFADTEADARALAAFLRNR